MAVSFEQKYDNKILRGNTHTGGYKHDFFFFTKSMLYLCYKCFTHVNALRTDALPSNQILKNHQNKQKRSMVVETLALKKST